MNGQHGRLNAVLDRRASNRDLATSFGKECRLQAILDMELGIVTDEGSHEGIMKSTHRAYIAASATIIRAETESRMPT
jgi:hypothetical protein